MSLIQRMDHFTIVTDRLDETRRFYALLGLEAGPRPDFGFGGLWLYLGSHAALHVIETGQMPSPVRGAIDHIAFLGSDGADALALLKREGIAYRLTRLPPPFLTWQVFFKDPNGVDVEIDFDAGQDLAPA